LKRSILIHNFYIFSQLSPQFLVRECVIHLCLSNYFPSLIFQKAIEVQNRMFTMILFSPLIHHSMQIISQLLHDVHLPLFPHLSITSILSFKTHTNTDYLLSSPKRKLFSIFSRAVVMWIFIFLFFILSITSKKQSLLLTIRQKFIQMKIPQILLKTSQLRVSPLL
jgi:hypothetical protein